MSADIEIRFDLGGNFRNIAKNADQPFYVYAVVLSDRYLQLGYVHMRLYFLRHEKI